MKYRANASEPFQELYIKALDSMPVGTIVDFDGEASDIPTGWEIDTTTGVPTLIKERNYASGWTNEVEIPDDTKWLYLIVNGDNCENVFITPTILATYTTSAPYFIANKNGLVYQWCNDNGTIKGLFRSEGGTNTSIKIYAIK